MPKPSQRPMTYAEQVAAVYAREMQIATEVDRVVDGWACSDVVRTWVDHALRYAQYVIWKASR